MNSRATSLIKFAFRLPNRATALQSSKVLVNQSTASFSDGASALSDEINAKKMILEAALVHTPNVGWNNEALVAGASDVGYPSATAGLFRRGPIELVEYTMMKWNSQLREDLVTNPDFASMNAMDRVRHGLRLRLSYEVPYLSTWSQAMSLGALPPNCFTTAKNISDFCDEIWFRAGDRSADLSWFTKRATLAAVFANAEVFMLTDTSQDHEATWKLLDQRLKLALQASSSFETAGQIAGSVAGGVWSIVSIPRGPRAVSPESLLTLQKQYL